MKNLKKVLVLVLAMLMALSSLTVIAADQAAITFNTTSISDAMELELYRLFDYDNTVTPAVHKLNTLSTGFFAIEENKALLNLSEGEEVTALAALNYINGLSKEDFTKFTQKVYTYIKTNTVGTDYTAKINSGSSTIVNVDLGYYLVYKKSDDNAKAAVNVTDVNTNKTVTIKVDVPKVEKKIVLADNSEVDVTSAQINDVVEFKITSAIPNTTLFSNYVYQFNDTMSKGLTYVDNSAKLVIINEDNTEKEVAAGDYTVTKADGADNTTTLTVKFDNIKNYEADMGKKVVLKYNAKVNTNARAAVKDTNTVNLEYSVDPSDSTKTEKTPDDTVTVHNFKIDIDKVKNNINFENPETLTGAEFKLFRGEIAAGAVASGTPLIAVPIGTNSNDYRVGDGTLINNTTIMTNTNGKFTLDGLGEGKYTLVETKAPDGYKGNVTGVDGVVSLYVFEIKATYNEAGDIETINFTCNGGEKWIKLVQSNAVENSANIQVVNIEEDKTNPDEPVLPETGGMGTALFTFIGLALMIGAAILLITKKKVAE